MLEGIRSRLAQVIAPRSPVTAVRRFDAAAGGRRASGFGSFGRTASEVSASATITRSRARYLAANNPHVTNAVGNLVAAIVGSGITPAGDAEAVRRLLTWAAIADADGRTNFAGLQEAVAQSVVVDGEAFVRFVHGPEGLRLQLLPAEMVDESKIVELRDGGFIVNGVEFDAMGKRQAYWVLPARPTDQFASYRAPVRVPASDILHVYRPLGIGQVRGISWLAPIVLAANEFDATVDALALGIKIACMHAGFLVDMNGTGSLPIEGDQSGSVLEGGLEPGTLRVLPAGFDVRFSSPGHANETAAFLRFQLQTLAAGLGVPEHLLSGDLTGANYSSLRAGLLPFRARVEQFQYNCLVPQFLDPVWRRVHFLESASTGQTMGAAVEWLPPRWAQVDPLKDTEAAVAEIEAGLTSRRKAVAERGWNVDQLDAEIAADRQREAALDLNFGGNPKDTNNAKPTS